MEPLGFLAASRFTGCARCGPTRQLALGVRLLSGGTKEAGASPGGRVKLGHHDAANLLLLRDPALLGVRLHHGCLWAGRVSRAQLQHGEMSTEEILN